MQNIDSDLIRGNIDTIILKTMLNEDKYGLDIIKEVSDKSNGTYELKQPTLYSCLKRLENQELISSYWVDSDIGGRRHYYKLTEKGRDFYNKKQEEWAKSKFIIDNLLSNYNYEEYRLVKKDEFDEMLEKKANAPLYDELENKQSNEDNDDASQALSQNFDDDSSSFSENLDDEKISDIEESDDETSNQDEDFDNTNYINYNSFEEDDSLSQDFEDEELTNFENNKLDDYMDSSDNRDILELGDSEDTNDINSDIQTIDEDNSDDDYPVYFSTKQSLEETTDKDDVSYETSDQSSNELNILSRLRNQEDEEINTYYGDQKSYVNHLRNLDESQLEQQDLLDNSLYINPNEVNKSIDEFSNAIDQLNNFNSSSSQDDTIEESEIIEENNESNEDNFFDENIDIIQSNTENDDYDDLDELKTLDNMSSTAFFNSEDENHYDINQEKTSYETHENSFENEFVPETKNMSFEEIRNEIEQDNPYLSEDKYSLSEEALSDEENNMKDIDAIISNNITTPYTEPTQAFYQSQNTNYREKLSDLSKYSRVTLEEEKQPTQNDEAIEKAKDIAEITKELEEEGIRVKEHYKSTSGKKLDRHYLLSNRINLMKSLIMFFGYVFILSALYIVLNNTTMSRNPWFSIKPFLIGFIPFAVYLIYYAIIFMINPYKKVDSKYHSRIMLFISVIITVQLLLITYCVNLQLGFYSFTQLEYNHLYWIIPSIISFAPIIDNFVYLALFKSRNFNV